MRGGGRYTRAQCLHSMLAHSHGEHTSSCEYMSSSSSLCIVLLLLIFSDCRYNSLKDTYLRKLNAKQAAGSGVGVDNGDDASRDGIQNNLPTRYLLLASGQAGLLTSAVTHPIWMIKTRMQLQKRHQNQTLGPTAIPDHLKIPYRSTQDGIRQIIKHEGLPALYTGFLPTVLLVSHGMIHFVLYDELKRLYSDAAQKESQFLNTYESFIISGSAKLVAALTTYPLQVVKTRLQDPANLYGSVRYTGMLDVLRSMYRCVLFSANLVTLLNDTNTSISGCAGMKVSNPSFEAYQHM